MQDRVYGVIVEWKQEQPLIMESRLLNYEEASEKMVAFCARPEVIRVAIFKASYETGNETILPKQE